MTFTDKDLKRLKWEFEPYVLGDPRILTGSDWEGLIARLEAAESSMLTAGQLRQIATWIVRHGNLTNAQLLTAEIIRQKADMYEVWRKAAAK